MNIDEIDQLIRMAQVLRVRARTVAIDLTKLNKRELAERATKASELSESAELHLAFVRRNLE